MIEFNPMGIRFGFTWRPKWRIVGPCCLLALMPAQAAVGDNSVNSLQCQGVFGIVFNQAAVAQQLAVYLINNDYTNAFDITFHFANKGKFKSGSNEIAMSSILLNKLSGTLGAGLTSPSNLAVTLDGSGDWVWDPGTTQTTETSALLLELKASWPDGSNSMAGFYSETITATISVGL